MLISGCCVDVFPRFQLENLGTFVFVSSRDPDKHTPHSAFRNKHIDPLCDASIDIIITKRGEPPGILLAVRYWLFGTSKCCYTRGRGTPRRATVIQIERTVDHGFRKSRLLYCCHGTRAAGFKLSKPNLSPQRQSIFLAVLLVCFVH